MGLKNKTVKLEYDYLAWKKMFLEEKENLSKLFSSIAINIEHIGSTSVEGLKAKPIVDIAIAVNNLSDFDKVENNIKEEYEVVKDKYDDEILLAKEKNNITYFLIHVMEKDSKRYKDTIIFRNYLRNNPNILKKYEELKVMLAQKYYNNRKMYTKSKNDFIQDILKEANKLG